MASDPQYRAGECGETSGFLFSHRCGEFALNVCGQCQKPICQQHTVVEQDLLLCTTCAKDRMQSGNVTNRDRYRDDPYFYSSYHSYPMAMGHASSDFTDADEQALRQA